MSLGPFIRDKISRDLHKTRLMEDASLTIYSLLSHFYFKRVLSKIVVTHILYRLYVKLVSYVGLSRVFQKSRLNGPIVFCLLFNRRSFVNFLSLHRLQSNSDAHH